MHTFTMSVMYVQTFEKIHLMLQEKLILQNMHY